MNKWTPRFLGTLALSLGLGLSGYQLNAQQSAPAPDRQTPTQQSPSDPAAAQPAQQAGPGQNQNAPDTQANSQSSSPADSRVFTGTVVKSGDKYVLQSADGTAYDVDQQSALKKFEGKQVRINGTLDADGKTIHVK